MRSGTEGEPMTSEKRGGEGNGERPPGDPPVSRPWAWEPSPAAATGQLPAEEPGGDLPPITEPGGPPIPPPDEGAAPTEPGGDLPPSTDPAGSPIPPPLSPTEGAPPAEPPGEQTPPLEATSANPPPPISPAYGWAPPPGERYPMHFDVQYPEGLSRWKTLLRVFFFVPVYLFMALLQYFLFLGLMLGWTTVFWRRKYPRWLFEGISGGFGFSARSAAYLLLLTDKFPSFSREQSPVTLEFDEPPEGRLSRWRVLFWKLILLIPHFIVLQFITIALFAVTVIAWFGILFTGNYPRGLFQFSVGVQRWYWRIQGYFASFNDRFPPYALSAEAGPASTGATVANGVIGGLVTAGFAAIIVAAAVIEADYETVDVQYALLQAGEVTPVTRFEEDFTGDFTVLRLMKVVDPGDELVEVLRPAPSERIVVFQWTVSNRTANKQLVTGDAARLMFEFEEDDEEKIRSITAALIGVNNVVAPANVQASDSATVQAVFVVPAGAEPLELRFRHGFAAGGVKYVFD